MLYRRSTQLALQTTLLLAREPEGAVRRVCDLATELGVTSAYLTKVLQSLSRTGLVQSLRGPGGGVQLTQLPEDISLWDVLSAVEPVDSMERCFLGLGRCSDSRPCPLHEAWAPLRNCILRTLQTRTLGEFAREADRKGLFEEKKEEVSSATGRGRKRRRVHVGGGDGSRYRGT